MGRREVFHTFSLLVEIEGHFTNKFVTYVYEAQNRIQIRGKIYESRYVGPKKLPVWVRAIQLRIRSTGLAKIYFIGLFILVRSAIDEIILDPQKCF
jgi:hypothetical protein